MTSIALQIEDAEQQTLREDLHEAHFANRRPRPSSRQPSVRWLAGKELVTEAQAEIQRSDDAARVAAENEASRLANEAADRPAGLPDDGAGVRAQARQIADQRLADATRAVGLLQREAEAAKADLATAARKIDAAVGALMFERGERLASELVVAELLARDLRLQLVALGGQWLPQGGQPAPVRLGDRAVRALNDLPLNDDRRVKQGPAHLSPVAPFARDWARIIAALQADPDAPMPGMVED